MQQFHYDGKTFIPVSNSATGQVDARTSFSYHQNGHVVWATYEGGAIAFGTLIGVVDENGRLTINYQHVSVSGELMTGKCVSVPELLPDGRIRLNESWRWTCGDCSSGTSSIEEVLPAT